MRSEVVSPALDRSRFSSASEALIAGTWDLEMVSPRPTPHVCISERVPLKYKICVDVDWERWREMRNSDTGAAGCPLGTHPCCPMHTGHYILLHYTLCDVHNKFTSQFNWVTLQKMNEVAAVIFNANCIAILGIISYSSPFIKWWKFRRNMRWRGQANGGRKCGNGAYFVHFYSFEVRQLFAPFFPLASNILVFSIREGVNDYYTSVNRTLQYVTDKCTMLHRMPCLY